MTVKVQRTRSLQHLRLQNGPLLSELLFNTVFGKDAVYGLLREIPHGLSAQTESRRCQLIFLRQVCAEDPFIISLQCNKKKYQPCKPFHQFFYKVIHTASMCE